MVPWETRLFCFPESPDVSRDEVVGKKKLTVFPRDHTLSVYGFPREV